MERHTLRNVSLTVNGENVASFPEAVVNLELDRIEVKINEAFLSDETIGFLSLSSSKQPKQFTVEGTVNDRILIVEEAMIYQFTFDAKVGEPVFLRNISILGLRARWK